MPGNPEDGDPASTEFEQLSELILYVADIEQMASFYADVFGLEPIEGKPDHGFVKFDTGACHLCLHAGGEGDLGVDAPKFVFEVDDIERARSYLQERAVDIGSIRSPAPGKRVCDGVDPEGNTFSIESTER